MAVQMDANRQLIESYRETVERGDLEGLTRLQREAIADDFVQEWPQSGERIRGENALKVSQEYSSATGTNPTMKLRRITGEGNHYVVEATIDYGDGTPVSYVGIAELRDGKLMKLTEYFANPFPAPEWRAKYVERM